MNGVTMTIIKERYASAVNSSNLCVKSETTYSDTDVLIAMGIAARYHPLGAALQRLFVDGKATECVDLMAKMARAQSHKVKSRLSPFQCQKLARKVLAWCRHGVCTDCGGTGKEVIIEPKPHLSDVDCDHCQGGGVRLFETNFSGETLGIAIWLRNEVSKHQHLAGKEAMRVIGANMDL